MKAPRQCSRCGVALPADAPGGHCLRCLLGLGLTPPPPTPEESPDAAAVASDRPAGFEQPGDCVGPYRLLSQIGEGGFGVVFLAEQTKSPHRQVALKVIKLGLDTRAVLARFKHEQEALSRMDHPNIAHILGGGATAKGRPYFVMDYVPGPRLTDYCDEQGLTVPERIRLFIQVCHAVQHAHQKGVIHRDLKPSNVLVNEQEGRPVPKVIDFGVAKAALDHPFTSDPLSTVTGQFAGTLAYMSPEQAGLRSQDVDSRSDIYSLGVVLYELLTAQPAVALARLHDADQGQVLRVIRDEDPTRPSTRLAKLSPDELAAVANRRRTDPARLRAALRGDLDSIVSKALDKERNRRYETASGLAMDLERHLRHEPVLARPQSRRYRLRKFIRRHRVGFITGNALALALLLGLGSSTWLYLRERAALRQAEAAEQAAAREARLNRETADFLEDMLAGIRPAVAQGRDTTLLRDIVNRASRRLDAGLRRQPEVEARLRSAMGRTYDELGEHTPAEAAFRRALELRRERFGPRHPEVALSLNHLGNSLWYQRRYGEAETAYREALDIFRDLRPPDEAALGATYGNLGNLLALQRQFADAEAMYRQALALQRRDTKVSARVVAQTLCNLGAAVADSGRLEEAIALQREALEMRRAFSTNATPELAFSLNNLAVLLSRQERHDEAIEMFREALAVRRKLLPPNHPDLAHSLEALARECRRQRELAAAESLFQEALVIRRQRPASEGDNLADCLHGLALVLREERRFADAESLLAEALTALQTCPDADTNTTRVLQAALRDVRERQGKPAE